MIRTLLIANRGEVACRIARTAWDLGIRSVAVFAPPDRGARHIDACEQAMEIPDYLDGDAIVAAAKASGADAVHPGFGFLAENASFAASVIDAGLIWVGPPPAAIEAMGSKARARAMMLEAGVPVLPGYEGADQGDKTLAAEAKRIGWPIIVKPSAGGGGKGMIVVEGPDALLSALAEARRLAKSAFGDDRLVLERYLAVARHVEVQVLADAAGNTVHLWERECSIQRRHQKVIEEAPSPAFTPDDPRRAALCEHAVQAARSVDYVGAGTVEFIVDGEGQAYFLEMNTRLQVEHPVTEMVTGLDIVALQLSVADGAALPLEQADVPCDGWSVEARLYAEDPGNDFLPCTGTVGVWHEPEMPGVRIDTGVRTGSVVGIHYDPMLAKVIAHGPTRLEAIRRLAAALDRLTCLGVQTNRAHLCRTLAHPDFAAGDLHTGFLAEHHEALAGGSDSVSAALVAAVVHDWQSARAPGHVLPGLRPNWRNSRWRDPTRTYRHGDAEHAVVWHDHGDHLTVNDHVVRVLDSGSALHLEIDGTVQRFCVAEVAGAVWVRTPEADVCLERVPDFAVPGADLDSGGCAAPMPGKVVQVLVVEGENVQKGAALVVLEAMKMEQTLSAAADATVAAVHVAQGDQVDSGQILVTLEPA